MFTYRQICKCMGAVAALALIMASGAYPAAAAVSSVTVANPGPGTYGEDDDYFTRVWGNPRDMEQASDLYLLHSTCGPTQIRRFSNESIADGTWTATTSPRAGDGSDNRDVYVLNPGWGSSLNLGEDGQVRPIDAGRYTQLSFRLYASTAPGADGNVVFTRGEIGSMDGAVRFRVYAGWNLYTIDLGQRSGSWSGQVTGLWFNLDELPSGVTLRLDWLRLAPKATRQVRWTGSGSGSVGVYLGSNLGDPGARSRVRIYERSAEANDIQFADSPLTVPASLRGGVYYAGVDDGGGIVGSSGGWNIRPAPIAEIVAPSYASGEDWATTVTGNPWDMEGMDDVSGGHSEGVACSASGGAVHTSNTAPLNSNPCYSNWPHRALALNLQGRSIDTAKYRYFSFRYKVDQAPDQGAGSVARVRWLDDRVWAAGRTDDISLYNNGWIVYKLDLSTVPLEVEGAPWAERSYNILQILVNESHSAWTSHVDWAKLTAENQARDAYLVRWEMLQGRATSVTLYWDEDRNPYNGFASGGYRAAGAGATVGAGASVGAEALSGSNLVYLPLVVRHYGAGQHAFLLSTAGLQTGRTYYAALKLEDGCNTAYWYSELPVRKIP